MEPLTVPPVTTRAALRGETVSSGNGIGATNAATPDLAALLHELAVGCTYGYGEAAHAEGHKVHAARLTARGVTVGLDVERLAAALEEAAGYTSPASHGRPAREEYRLWLHGALHDIESIARAYAATPAPSAGETVSPGNGSGAPDTATPQPAEEEGR